MLLTAPSKSVSAKFVLKTCMTGVLTGAAGLSLLHLKHSIYSTLTTLSTSIAP